MIINSDVEDRPKDLSSKILDLKQKYSPEELKSILSQFEDPINKDIAKKLLDLK